jgi:hypothetical protein
MRRFDAGRCALATTGRLKKVLEQLATSEKAREMFLADSLNKR